MLGGLKKCWVVWWEVGWVGGMLGGIGDIGCVVGRLVCLEGCWAG